MRVLVIGAGPAGTRCAERLAGRGARVALAGAEPALPYDRIALGRLLAGDAEVPALITHDAARLRGLGIRYLPATRVAALDRAAGTARTARGEALDWDRVVLATGSDAVRLPLPGAALPGVFLYRSMADVQAIRRAAAGGARAVVIGGGLLGLEAAAALSVAGARVTVVHALGWPMERQLDPAAGALLARQLGATRRLRFVMPAVTEAIEGDGRVEALRLADGTRIACSLVVMAVGIRPSVALARESGLEVKRGIVVDDAMRSSDPRILAIGECAEHRGQVCGLVAPALAMAEAAAMTLAGESVAYAPRPDAAALKVSGIAVWSAGEVAPADAEAVTLSDEEAGVYRRLWLRGGRLVGAVLYGDTADAGFYLDLITGGRPVAPFRARLAFGAAHAEAA
ncbi:NAD(P)/FAD-dependent oxidoreductase [Roseomonas sp. PWR1]|uniref:NAD(P)/FAD-dependent oxidoreductase n=1 Tax=Roseomonas nitratireducens TaxID=2820810 RepID=A0ABS4AQ71_9PROT|nr:FAD-dependent oxidoreductase [Neoroseomonas nitratireducens]MBP0462717.1 NAD(P)/FAD-dependent oxidoreductase [Neoroseomonas nitratireducens]